ncbi:peptidoglycan DD-metalloendopeptidase family protein [Cellulomonas marina]|nr:peptidoglycan DD-metalloendopeptidase family protein [Cellulomonas marina]
MDPRRSPATPLLMAALLVAGVALPLLAAPAYGGSSTTTVAAPATTASAAEGWRLPVASAVLAPFVRPPQPWAAGHRGLDVRADPGTVVRAPATGTVGFAGVVAGRAVVVVRHDGGLRSTLEPVTATVPIGTVVEVGDEVGTVAGTVTTAGASHCADRCVHWGVREGDRYLDPGALVVRLPRVVLLPW